MRITHSKQFKKQYEKLGPKLKARVRERIVLFLESPFNPVLENHPLHGKYSGFRSINITGDIRLIYETIGDDAVHLALLGTHSQLYGK